MTLGDRIKKLRKALDLTQQGFADRIGSKRNTVATYEMGRTTPSAAIISLICREFNVSETWLRTGEGEMFLQPYSRKEEIEAMVENMMRGRKADFKFRLISVLNTLEENQWEVLEDYLKRIVGLRDVSRTEPTLTIEQEARMEAERYYQELLAEKKQEFQALSANGSDVG